MSGRGHYFRRKAWQILAKFDLTCYRVDTILLEKGLFFSIFEIVWFICGIKLEIFGDTG